MDFREELHCEKVESAAIVINEYISLYLQFLLKYENRVDLLKKEFINKFKDEDFEVIKKYSIYDTKFKSKEIVLATNENLEVKLDVHNIGSSESDICTYNLENGFVYTSIITSIRSFKIDFFIGNSKTIKKIRSVKDLEDIKKGLVNDRYTLDEINNIIESVSNNKTEVLEKEYEKLKDIYFILIEKSKSGLKKKISFSDIDKLYSYIHRGVRSE